MAATKVVKTIEVTCEYHDKVWDYLDKHYQCEFQKLTVKAPGEVIEKIDGRHLLGKIVEDVKSFYIENTTCYYMPQGIERFYPNIEGIAIKGTNSTLR